MDRRFAEAQSERIIELLEGAIGKKLNSGAKEKLLEGPNEINLVRSGLEDTMREAYNEIKAIEDGNEEISTVEPPHMRWRLRKLLTFTRACTSNLTYQNYLWPVPTQPFRRSTRF